VCAGSGFIRSGRYLRALRRHWTSDDNLRRLNPAFATSRTTKPLACASWINATNSVRSSFEVKASCRLPPRAHWAFFAAPITPLSRPAPSLFERKSFFRYLIQPRSDLACYCSRLSCSRLFLKPPNICFPPILWPVDIEDPSLAVLTDFRLQTGTLFDHLLLAWHQSTTVQSVWVLPGHGHSWFFYFKAPIIESLCRYTFFSSHFSPRSCSKAVK